MGWGMRNESQDNFSALHSTVLLSGGQATHTPNCTWRCRKMQEHGVGGEGTQLLNASRMVLPYPGCMAKFSGAGRTCSSWESCCSGSLGSPAH